MKNALLIVTVLFAAIMSTACINNFAVQELNNKAAEYLSKGDYDSAIGRLETSLDIDPTIFETNYNLGVAYINAEKYEKAVEVLNKASSIKPEQSDIYYSLAVAQYNAAEDILEGKNEEIDDDEADEQPLVQDGQMSAKKEISIEDKQEAAKLYSDAIKSLFLQTQKVQQKANYQRFRISSPSFRSSYLQNRIKRKKHLKERTN